MSILLQSLKAEFGRSLSVQHRQKISRSLRNRKQNSAKSKTKLVPFANKEHRAAYDQIGGRAIARDIANKNPRMSSTMAENYTRESAQAYTLSALGQRERGRQEQDRINRKYDRYFGR